MCCTHFYKWQKYWIITIINKYSNATRVIIIIIIIRVKKKRGKKLNDEWKKIIIYSNSSVRSLAYKFFSISYYTYIYLGGTLFDCYYFLLKLFFIIIPSNKKILSRSAHVQMLTQIFGIASVRERRKGNKRNNKIKNFQWYWKYTRNTLFFDNLMCVCVCMFRNSKDEEKWISLIFHLYNLNNLAILCCSVHVSWQGIFIHR